MPILRHHWFKPGDQIRDIVLDSVPDQAKVDVEVPVNESVTHADDVLAWNRRMLLSDLLIDARGRLSDDLNGLDDG